MILRICRFLFRNQFCIVQYGIHRVRHWSELSIHVTKQAESLMRLSGHRLNHFFFGGWVMSNTEITAVRIDIYKDESTVVVCRPDGQIMLKLFTALHMVGATTSGENTHRNRTYRDALAACCVGCSSFHYIRFFEMGFVLRRRDRGLFCLMVFNLLS